MDTKKLDISGKKKKHKFSLPTAYTILFFLIALIIIISWIPGTTEIKKDASGNAYGGPAGIFDLFLAVANGFKQKIDTIIFVLVIGPFIGVTVKSNALNAGITRLIMRMKGKEIYLIPILLTLFSLGGTTYGMGEETIALYPVLVPVMLAAGFDMTISIMVILLGAGVGCLASSVNPFMIGVAASSYDKFSTSDGMIWRWIAWVIMTVAVDAGTTLYALYIKKHPNKSVLYNDREFYIQQFAISTEIPEYKTKHKIIMGVFFSVFILMIASMISYSSFGDYWTTKNSEWVHTHAPYIESLYSVFGDWGMLELAALFLIGSIVIACINRMGEKEYINTFMISSADILSVCWIIGVAGGISWILDKTCMGTVLVNSLSKPLSSLGTTGFVIVAFFPFLLISFFIPSSSGVATAVMPIAGPISESIHPGLSAGCTLSLSFANGLINLFSPTSGIMMAALSITKVPLNKWYRSAWPFVVGIFVLSIILLAVGSLITSGGIFYGTQK